ncbi:RNA-binding protein Hfq [Bacillus clarus]|uniref:Putative host factor-I protein n=1 Tax=Bacillus clarus TaxID=2338372 RepID=A0A090YUJ8_9BACI|nr:RNA chaperone Hfq [Bacillus clarus]KFN01947.1 putative host factor-I protein [Bacillus clarus]RFT68479.1 RNA-binding protein Hfq [Bacillus clarus]
MKKLQEDFYEKMKGEKGEVTVFLKSGVKIVGDIIALDRFTIFILVNGK